jgi:hypothetical protein
MKSRTNWKNCPPFPRLLLESSRQVTDFAQVTKVDGLRYQPHSAVAPWYEMRSPEQTLLYSVVASKLETFLAERRSAEHKSPRFVEREFRAFLESEFCPWLPPGPLRIMRHGSRGRVLVQQTQLVPLGCAASPCPSSAVA